MIRNLLFFVLMGVVLTGWGQTRTEEANRAVFNKIEFFINTQMTDSIYNLASASFKEQVSHDQLTFVLNKLYPLGRITDVEVEDFKGNTATYRVYFTQEDQWLAKLAVDSNFLYTALSFTPTERKLNPAEPAEVEEIAPSQEVSSVDLFVRSTADSYLKKSHTQSLAIGVFHQNKYQPFLYGETEVGNGSAPTENTLYEIGSLTKVFTASLLADLVVKEMIGLDDSIVGYLPDSVSANPALQGITFKTLANHTSGLPRMADNWNRVPGFDERDPYAAYDQKALFGFLKNYQASREPGEEYEYSNLGYGLLGELIAVISQKPYTQLLEETILVPLQLSNTSDKPEGEAGVPPGMDKDGNKVTTWRWQAMAAAGGLKSTIRDLMLFSVEQFKMPENDLQKAMALTRQFTFFTPENTDIGLAWHMSMTEDGIMYFHHTGGTSGSSSFIGLSPDTKTAVVILSNAAESVDQIGTAIMEKLLTE